VIVDYIDEHRDALGVEPICQVLSEAGTQIAPRTYYAAKTRAPSARSASDALTRALIEKVHADNYSVYGARKVHAELHRQVPADDPAAEHVDDEGGVDPASERAAVGDSCPPACAPTLPWTRSRWVCGPASARTTRPAGSRTTRITPRFALGRGFASWPVWVGVPDGFLGLTVR